MSEKVLRKKDYPLNYPSDVLDIINAMSFDSGNVNIVGSMSLKSQQYAGDYDMIETVKGSYASKDAAVKAYSKKLKEIVRSLMAMKDVFIGDIKAGLVEDWVVVPDAAGIRKGKVTGYDSKASRTKLEELRSNKILTEEEFKYASKLVVNSPSVEEFLVMKKELRFHLVRWTPEEILKGTTTLRDGRKMSLEDALKSPTIVKLDVVAYVQNSRFTDFSIIYLFQNKGSAINRVETGDEIWAIKQDLLYYLNTGNYFKAAKRLFSLARKANDVGLIEKLNTMMNGDLGRLYGIVSDLGTLLYLLENESNIPTEKVRYELDQFRSRLGNIYSLNGVSTDSILHKLLGAEGLPSNAAGRKKLKDTLEFLQGAFEDVLSKQSKDYLTKEGIAPFKKSYLP